MDKEEQEDLKMIKIKLEEAANACIDIDENHLELLEAGTNFESLSDTLMNTANQIEGLLEA